MPTKARILLSACALAALGLILFLGGCGENEATPGPGAAGTPPGGGARPQWNQAPTPVAVAAATTGDIASHYEATATLEAEKQAEILARVQGVVGQLLCEEGDRVEAGQTLLVVANEEYRLRLEQAAARTANLAARHERLLRMREEELASEEEYETARADLAAAEADEGLARLDLEYTSVTAPFAGRIVARLVDPGQNLSVGTPLLVLADFDPLLARVHVPARELRNIRLEQPVTLVLDSDATRLSGRIDLISPVIDAASGTIKITVEVDDFPAGTRPGDFAAVRIVTEVREDATLVPAGAVITDKGSTVAYVAVAGGAEDAPPTAERRVVETGFSDAEFTQIVSGIAAGETVVVRGQRSLKQASPLKILEGPGAGAPTQPRPGEGRPEGGGKGKGVGGGQGGGGH